MDKKEVCLLTDKEVLQRYIDLVPFLGAVMGSGCEIIVHDLADLDHSLVAICNGVSGLELGNPITDLARALIQRSAHTDADYLANYMGRTKNVEFLSSTYYIKNEGRLIGLLCVNKDMTAVQEAADSFQALLERFNLAAPRDSEFTETLDNPVSAIMRTRIADIIAQSGKVPSRMTPAEKAAAVGRMSEDGVLMMKGAVPEIAQQLGVSVPTIYRYLSKRKERSSASEP